jgi:hypothetical protein
MKKRKLGRPLKWIITASFLIGIGYYSFAQTESGTKTHLCVLTTSDPGSSGGVVDCENSGSTCNGIADCVKTQ